MSGLKLVDGPTADSFAVVSFLLYGCYSNFNDRADVQEQFIGRLVTVSVGQAGVGGFIITNLVSCSCVVCVSELEVSWLCCMPKSSLFIAIFLCNFQYICNVWFQ
jgi:hypothetical protein